MRYIDTNLLLLLVRCGLRKPWFYNNSAICTAFNAAPLSS